MDLIRVGQELLFVGEVLGRRRTAWQRARDGPERRPPFVEPHEGLRRRTDDFQIVEVEIEHVRRRIDQPHRAIHLERRHVRAALEQHRDDDLVDIAGGDVFLAGLDAVAVLGLGQARSRRGCLQFPRRFGHGPAQPLDDLAPQTLALVFGPVVQQCDAAREVIEDEQRRGRREGGVGDAGLRFGLALELFEQPHDVVTRDADQPAGERQFVDLRLGTRRKRQRFAQRIEIGIAGLRPGSRLPVHDQRITLHANLERVAEA